MTSTDTSATTPPPTSDARPVVVGVDGSDSSRRALVWAAFVARSMGVGLEAVTAWQPMANYTLGSAGWTAFPGDWDPSQDAQNVLDDTVATAFGDARPDDLKLSVREGTAAQVLIDASEHAAMIVVGSRGHGGFVGLLLGSVSAACSEHAKSPVLVVHGDAVPGA